MGCAVRDYVVDVKLFLMLWRKVWLAVRVGLSDDGHGLAVIVCVVPET